ncbi:LysR family transcriptional regulator [uncultured Ruegeria sp.]|uniref:LysR family transcriptional regulator n=1 Tax=uncultured Ruegeria sp. TaxID=259304 RepID=UPI00261D1610|nr:LysR family transcriptional regulator [uncultured Ruegeria sp.]
MEYRQLRYFVAAADLGNIGLAANKLNVSQPPISRQIRALEEELGVTLLFRTPKGVEMTAAGRVFRTEAIRILERTELARERTRQASEGTIGQLDVAVFGTAIYSVVPRTLRRFRDENPGTTAQILPMSKAEQVESILSGRAHIAFGRYFSQTAGLVVRNLASEQLYVALPHGDGPQDGTPIQMAEAASHPLILFPAGDRPGFADDILTAFATMNLSPHIEAFAPDVTSTLSMVSAGMGAAILPEAVAALRFPGVELHRLIDCPIAAPLACLCSEEPEPVLTRFLTVLDDWLVEA